AGLAAERVAQRLLERLDEGPVREREILGAAATENQRVVVTRALADLLQESRLTDPGLALHQHQPRAAREGVGETALEHLELPVTPDEGWRSGQAPRDAGAVTRPDHRRGRRRPPRLSRRNVHSQAARLIPRSSQPLAIMLVGLSAAPMRAGSGADRVATLRRRWEARPARRDRRA